MDDVFSKKRVTVCSATYVSRSTKLNKKEKKLYVDAMVANIFGHSLLLQLLFPFSSEYS